jgi:CCR4-NOT transcription complex subunit 4
LPKKRSASIVLWRSHHFFLPNLYLTQTITILRSSDYFGRYGKISRIQLHKRTPPGSDSPIVGVYITYVRREDAERAIQAIDGTPSPGGGGEVMRASYGTAKYCMSFLRSVTCSNANCLDTHEWGESDDCFTREELATLYVLIPFSCEEAKFVLGNIP